MNTKIIQNKKNAKDDFVIYFTFMVELSTSNRALLILLLTYKI
jgi:hypothetical protein